MWESCAGCLSKTVVGTPSSFVNCTATNKIRLFFKSTLKLPPSLLRRIDNKKDWKEKKPEKGKPSEKMGRKATGLTPLVLGGGMVAGSPGESSTSQKMHVARG